MHSQNCQKVRTNSEYESYIKEDKKTMEGPSSVVCEAAPLNGQHTLPYESQSEKIWTKKICWIL